MFSINCLFCGNFAKLCDGKRGHDVFEVRTLEFQNTIRDDCKKRNDDWGDTVLDQPLYWKALQIASSDCQDISVNSIVFSTRRISYTDELSWMYWSVDGKHWTTRID